MMRSFAFFCCLLLVSACTEKIDLDLNKGENRRLVVDAFIDDRPATDTVALTLSTNYFSEEPIPPATGASVWLTFEGNDIFFREIDSLPGYYISPEGFIGQPGRYRLNISHEGKQYFAEETLLPVNPIDSLVQKKEDKPNDEGEDLWQIFITFRDPAGQRNFYLFRERVNGEYDYENLFEFGATFRDVIIDGQFAEQIPYGTFALQPGDTLTVEMMSISETVYNILNAMVSESEFRGGFFDPPPANVPSNIQGDPAVGLFIASAVSGRDIVIE